MVIVAQGIHGRVEGFFLAGGVVEAEEILVESLVDGVCIETFL